MKASTERRTLYFATLAGLTLALTLGVFITAEAQDGYSGGVIHAGWNDPPSKQCRGFTEGASAWCNCMGSAIDDLNDEYQECEEQAIPSNFCQQLFDDFDNWFNQC